MLANFSFTLENVLAFIFCLEFLMRVHKACPQSEDFKFILPSKPGMPIIKLKVQSAKLQFKVQSYLNFSWLRQIFQKIFNSTRSEPEGSSEPERLLTLNFELLTKIL